MGDACKALRTGDKACRCGTEDTAVVCGRGNICSLKDPPGPTKPTPVCFGLHEENELLTEIETTEESLYCVHPTKKPRCTAFGGILKSDSRLGLICDSMPAEPSCLDNVISQLCKDDVLCGADKAARDVMTCCDKNGNKPGKGCTAGRRRRRRLGSSLKIDGKLQKGKTTEECAAMCLMHNDGLATHKDGCVAWRLNDFSGTCEIATTCYPKKAGKSPESWHVFKGVSPFKPPFSLKFGSDGVATVKLVKEVWNAA